MIHIITPAIIISILYFIVKWLKEKRQENHNVKAILNDTIFVFLTSGLSLYLYDNIKSFLIDENSSPFVFTDQPNF